VPLPCVPLQPLCVIHKGENTRADATPIKIQTLSNPLPMGRRELNPSASIVATHTQATQNHEPAHRGFPLGGSQRAHCARVCSPVEL
jgi:hypothetical protein